jgi:hypothetical protein
MSRLERFLGKPKEIDLGGEKLMIHPLTMDDMKLIVKLQNPETQAEGMKELISLTLKKAVPDATDEEINKFSFEYFTDLMEAINEVNHLGEIKKKLK